MNDVLVEMVIYVNMQKEGRWRYGRDIKHIARTDLVFVNGRKVAI